MSVTEINFKCEHCGQEFWYDNFNIAVFLLTHNRINPKDSWA
ncbi:MAG: hypothetical protein SRB2_02313 [Desulfobacteraceae bacterium Eth-SRB2]|nr:MAG: hypothetical protein SRB2_02313 [Desulfobacteraceae bacterium Eth-SRB2]